VIGAIGHALSITASMTWAITWALILGFTLSALVQAVARKSTVVRLFGDDRPRTLARAAGLGAASSSCSYAAVALARSLFRQGADFTAATAFEIASTNLVIELGSRVFSGDGYTAVAHVFVMEWAAIIRDLVIGLLAAGAIAAWVPDTFWQAFFITGHPLAAKVCGPLIGPVVAIISFVCSIGNVPLAVVLWKGGISFGGVVAFIFAGLIIAPILNIYRKYYGAAMALFLLGTFYAAMVGAGYLVEVVFGGLGLIPSPASAKIPDQGVSWDYTTWLNIIFLLLAAALIVRFVRTGGLAMLRMMGGAPDTHDH
jgi:uncharacterized membrane protein YraQ (UPF0718 family)